MVLARFEFKPEYADQFIQSKSKDQTVVEIMFESVESMIATTREFEKYLIDCTAIVNNKILSLSSYKKL